MECHLASCSLPDQVILLFGAEGTVTAEQGKCDNTNKCQQRRDSGTRDSPNRPDIHLEGVSLSEQYLWGGIAQTPRCCCDLLVCFEVLCDTKIRDHDGRVGRSVLVQDVFRLEIAVDDRVSMKIGRSSKDLPTPLSLMS